MINNFEDILSAGLDRLISRNEDLDDILKSYPDHAVRLEPLLRTALLVSRTTQADPQANFRTRALSEFRSSVVAAHKKRLRWGLGFRWAWHRPWVTAACIALAVMVVAGTTAFAAAGSMPDEPLYPVKLATEQIQTVVTPSSLGKARLEARLAERRIEELSYLINKDKPEIAEKISDRLYSHYSQIENLVQGEVAEPAKRDDISEARPRPKARKALRHDEARMKELKELRRMLRDNYPRHEAALRKIEAGAVKSDKPGFRKAIERSLRGYHRAVVATGENEAGEE